MFDTASKENMAEYGDLFEPIFNDVVTLDPSRVEEVWDRLSVDTQQLELKSLNKILALSLYSALTKSLARHATKKT